MMLGTRQTRFTPFTTGILNGAMRIGTAGFA